MKYKLEEAVNAAIMQNQPLVIVEGIDDVKIYEAIAEVATKDLNIQPVEYFEEAPAGGCVNVENCLEILAPKFAERADYSQFILGVIDADVKPFRPATAPIQGLFRLKYYSIESYFIDDVYTKKLIAHLTEMSEKKISPQTINWVKSTISTFEEKLYIFSLECLKKAVDTTYTTLFSYDEDKISNTKGLSHLVTQLDSKKADLESFAASQSISQANLKQIAKGKHYLNLYLESINAQIKKLDAECKANPSNISQCDSCIKNLTKSVCLYKNKAAYNPATLANQAKSYICPTLFSDIIAVFKTLA